MNTMKRIGALLLAVAMLLSIAGCAKAPEIASAPQTSLEATTPTEAPKTESRQELEQIADLLGDGQLGQQMTDEELNGYVEGLIENLDIKTEAETGVTLDPEVYDSEGAMKVPFDQAYPELVEDGTVTYADESLLVKLNNGTGLTAGLKAAGVAALEEVVPMEKETWYEAKLTEGTDAEAALTAVRKLSEVKLAEFNFEITTAEIDHYKDFDDKHKEEFDHNEHHKDQWHHHHCGIPDGYEEMETEGGDPSVVVAVIDTGVDYDHEDLKDNIWVNTAETPDNGIDDDGNGYVDDYYGIDLVAGKGSADDDNGHGTHVAGIIAARNNNVGVLGLAYNVKIMPIKAAMHNGTLNQATIAKSVLYAYEMGAEVINMSFGGTACSIAVQDALATAYTRCVLVASAGNSGKPNEITDYVKPLPNYPAALGYVLGVMSVDENGVESSFTNWDTFAFNGVEYELYAPGENIMSTLPNDQYGYLSGTSMAAPIVAGMAAILRSEFADRDKYPTKFIYGQLASTSDYYATCSDPEGHRVNGMSHNLPQIVNLNAALTKLPKPEVGMQDFAIFDSADLSDKNNGDGVIDAGETIALGLTLQNRWGMSENTLVTIDTLENGISDPYVTIKNPTVDYGSVGTYSTQDAGAIYTDSLLTGWEHPFLIKIADNIPNDYRMTFHVTIKCENALDEADTAVYTSTSGIDLAARNGVVLPSIIEEDMVLTADNLYIIPNATVIQAGVTVRVEPGTHIQFWSDDPNDPYASNYIAYLLVNGNFLVEGTKEDPVYIYPSQLMDHYGVELGASSTGYVSLEYADVTNLFYDTYQTNHTSTGNKINRADHCTFRMNYNSGLLYRKLSSGKVTDGSITANIRLGTISATNSVFYKLRYNYTPYLSGSADTCVFVNCALDYPSTTNCVFSGCSNTRSAGAVTIPSVSNVYYRADTGTTYALASTAFSDVLRQEYGMEYAIFETQDEMDWLTAKLSSYTYYKLGIYYNGTEYVWSDGTQIPAFLDANGLAQTAGGGKTMTMYAKKLTSTTSTSTVTVYEIPGQILPTEITFSKYSVLMDTDMTYQVTALCKPVQLPFDAFRYESTDESVLTVSETGLVTPVAKGSADVYVYSIDNAVWNYISFEVAEYVPIQGLSFTQDSIFAAVGDITEPNIDFIPANTTRRQVTYTSDNSDVLYIDENGLPVAAAAGTATLTAECEGFTDTVTIHVYVPATSLELDVDVMAVPVNGGSRALPSLSFSPADAETDIQWTVSDPDVAEVNGDLLIPKAEGVAELIATDLRTGLSVGIPLYINGERDVKIERVFAQSECSYVLMSNGELYMLGNDNSIVKNVVDFDVYGYRGIAALEDGSVYTWNHDTGEYKYVSSNHWGTLAQVSIYGGNMYAINTDGYLYAWGANANDALGLGHSNRVEEPTQVECYWEVGSIKQIEAGDGCVLAITSDDSLYHLRYYEEDACSRWEYVTSAIMLSRHETSFIDAWNNPGYASSDGAYTTNTDLSAYDSVMLREGIVSVVQIGLIDGCVYWNDGKSTYSNQMIPIFRGLENVVAVWGVGEDDKADGKVDLRAYALTQDGYLYGMGHSGSGYYDYPFGYYYSNYGSIQQPVRIPGNTTSAPGELKLLSSTGITDTALTDSQFTVTVNKPIATCSAGITDQTANLYMSKNITCDQNRVTVVITNGLTEGHQYKVTLSLEAIDSSVYTRSFTFTYSAQSDEPGTADSVEAIHPSQTDTTIQRIPTAASITAQIKAVQAEKQINPSFYGNAVLNPISTNTNVESWFRIQAGTVTAGSYVEYPLGGNYWGTTDEKAIGLQMIDYTDFITYGRLMYAPYLTEAPENTFPFVTNVTILNQAGEPVTTVGNEKITVRITFNRDMDTSIPLQVRFGSTAPYGDYEIAGAYVDARTWEATYTLNTLIENGQQFWNISNGCSATDDLALQPDEARFGFTIDTTAAQALIMQGTATDTGVKLTWTQDDFDTLMGYNVYRATKEDGLYTRLNKTVIDADTMEFFDDTVEPGVVYYYNFTVVKTDLTESEPSGKIAIMSKDTMAPSIYHSPVANAFTGSNLVITATVTDNLSIAYANLIYRVTGTDTWKTVRMNKLNDKYSAIIPAADITLAGIEYYIEAFDGVSFTCKGSESAPYTVAVQQAVDANALGDVNGDGKITNLDALILLQAINDLYNMTAEEFARADINGDGELAAMEALRILHYASGKIGSVAF